MLVSTKNTLLTSTQVAAKIGLTANEFNKILYDKKILNKRGRRSKKNPKVFKAYWDLLELKYGVNIKNVQGHNQVKFYESMLTSLFSNIGRGGLV